MSDGKDCDQPLQANVESTATHWQGKVAGGSGRGDIEIPDCPILRDFLVAQCQMRIQAGLKSAREIANP
jgi:hypothetical protein